MDDPLDLPTALRYYRAGDAASARRVCAELLRRDPADAGAHHLMGMIAHRAGQAEQALASLGRAAALAPAEPAFHSDLGAVLGLSGRPVEAAAAIRRAVELRPAHAEYHSNLGVALEQSGDLGGAIASYRRAVALAPDYAPGHRHLGNALRRAGRCGEAAACYRRAIQIDPGYGVAYNGLAAALGEQGRPEGMIACYAKAAELRPDSASAHSDFLYSLHYSAAWDPPGLFAGHLRWARLHAGPLRDAVRPHGNDRSPGRRLRVGYVSPDFREHPVARFIEPVLAAHDRGRYEIVCYSDVTRPDPTTRRLIRLADRWRGIAGSPDGQVAELIRSDRIDVLVDLAGHGPGNRLLVFARKPAPVQVTYLGYPGTTGLAAMDYRVTDALADPPGDADRHHAERLLRLPRCAWCYRPPEDAPAVGPPPALGPGTVTFGCFNNLAKVTPEVVALWCRILLRVPDSRLLLKGAGLGDEQTRRAVCRTYEEHGVRADRLELLPLRPSAAEHMRTYDRVDVALDPFPYNGTTTTCDALWMGVPVLCLEGQAHHARVGLSLLCAVGLEDYVTPTATAYVDRAAAAAADLRGLAALRQGLRESVRRSPLADGPDLTRHLEAAYSGIWARWCASPERL